MKRYIVEVTERGMGVWQSIASLVGSAFEGDPSILLSVRELPEVTDEDLGRIARRVTPSWVTSSDPLAHSIVAQAQYQSIGAAVRKALLGGE